ncbi:MAG: hypothetical protein WC940_03060 [Candidatus Paceibacterota bacterium]|jgi:hypothetical protein
MEEIGSKELDKNKYRSSLLFVELEKHTDEVLKEYVKLPKEQFRQLRSLLSFRQVDTDQEVTIDDIKLFLDIISDFAFAIHSQAQITKMWRESKEREYEKLEYQLKKDAEARVKEIRKKERELGERKEMGQITADQIRGEMVLHETFSSLEQIQQEIDKFKYVESILFKTVELVENRRYDITNYLKIELGALNL